MRFDFTNGKKAKYLMSIHYPSPLQSDYCYFSDYRGAMNTFQNHKEMSLPVGTSISVTDIVKDVRKAFYRF